MVRPTPPSWHCAVLAVDLRPLQSKKRGMSLEEKRDKILEIFHETSDVFQLKVGPLA